MIYIELNKKIVEKLKDKKDLLEPLYDINGIVDFEITRKKIIVDITTKASKNEITKRVCNQLKMIERNL